MTTPAEFLTLDDVLDLCRRLLGDPPPIRDIGLLGSAAARPQTTIGGTDGNKRLGWLATNESAPRAKVNETP